MGATPPLAETAQCLCLASRRAARTITRAFEKELRAHGLKATQFSLLAALALKGPQTVGALAEFLCVERTTLTRNLAVVEARGLVASARGRDPRSRAVGITDEGRTLLERAFDDWRRVQSTLTASLGAEAADILRTLAGSAVGPKA